MGLLRLAALGTLGYVGYKYWQNSQGADHVAYASNQHSADIRDSGPAAMRDTPTREWTKTDEEMDQTFPASDPPANY